MVQLVFLALLLALATESSAQLNRADQLFHYLPAPGQFINVGGIGTPGAAAAMPQSPDSLVSLGSFGGAVVYGFPKPVANDPDNPYGVDFTIFGNSFSGSSEPGIVWVMNDENGNGLPDDTWYEIAGSSHFHPHTIKDYQLTWHREPDGSARWRDGAGKEGHLRKNSFYSQPYFPNPSLFPQISGDSMLVTGTLLPYAAAWKGGQVVLPALAFGYADNRSVNRQVSPDLPDNPYTPNVREGAGGDAIDISWAIDSNGNYVDLESIHFVKIVTGVRSSLEPIGEASTEIADIVATKPGSGSTAGNLMVIHPHTSELLKGDTLQLYASSFEGGRFVNGEQLWTTTHTELLSIDSHGRVIALAGGDVTIKASDRDLIAQTSLRIREPASIIIPEVPLSVRAGETLTLQPVLYDQYNVPVEHQNWVLTAYPYNRVFVKDAASGVRFQAMSEGRVTLTVYTLRFPELKHSFDIEILPAPETITILASAKFSDQNIFPLQKLEVSVVNLNPFFDQREADFSGGTFLQVAHAIGQMLSDSVSSFSFREDSVGAYLYKVEQEGVFTYGWGGRTNPAPYARSWMANLNGRLYSGGFEKLALSEGDTLQLFHVPNILHHFEVTALYASPQAAGFNTNITLRQVSQRGWHSESGFLMAPDTAADHTMPLYFNDRSSPAGYLPANGTLDLLLDQVPPVVIHAGPDAVLIAASPSTRVGLTGRSHFNIYPNPASGRIFISGIDQPFSCSITDITGRQRRSIWMQPGQPLDISGLTSGIYLVTVQEKNGDIHSVKLVVP